MRVEIYHLEENSYVYKGLIEISNYSRIQINYNVKYQQLNTRPFRDGDAIKPLELDSGCSNCLYELTTNGNWHLVDDGETFNE